MSIALPRFLPFGNLHSFPATCGTTPMPLDLPTKDLASQPLSAVGVRRRRSGRLDVISGAASRSAVPAAHVSMASTARPWKGIVLAPEARWRGCRSALADAGLQGNSRIVIPAPWSRI